MSIFMRIIPSVSLLFVLAAGINAETHTAPEDAKPQPAAVPADAIDDVASLWEVPEGGLSRTERNARMERAIELGRTIVETYPDAPNLAKVRQYMLEAAAYLVMVRRDEPSEQTLRSIAEDILNSNVEPTDKVAADFFAALLDIAPPSGAPIAPDPAAEKIRVFIEHYRETEAAAPALVHGYVLARQAQLPELQKELADTLQAEHDDEQEVLVFLRRIGREPFVGKKFAAELTRLNGTKLTLPDDLIGKVVVIDFWATWCGPCIRALPHMKELYAEYKSKGVEIVGISLDDNRERLVRFVKDRQIDWIQTYSGDRFDDPTTAAYAIQGIPSVWVIGRDGKVVSEGAIDREARSYEDALEGIDRAVEKALAHPVPEAEEPASEKPGDGGAN